MLMVVYSARTDSFWLTDGKGNFFMEFPTEQEARECLAESEEEKQ